jgi:hypothetical protein
MMDPLQRQGWIRCTRKRRYRKANLADAAAQRASIRTGELIISYQCYECLQWHIGHADKSQILARTSPGRPICEICAEPTPFDRLDKAKRQGRPLTTCSQVCRRELAWRTEQQLQPAASPSPDPAKPAVPKSHQSPPPKHHKINGRIHPIWPFHKVWIRKQSEEV